MTKQSKNLQAKAGASGLAAALRERVGRLLDALVEEDPTQAKDAFEHLLTRAGELWRRKQAMEGTKSETRDLLGEILFSRLRKAFRDFHQDADSTTEIRCAEWVLGMLFGGNALTEFATALDRAMLEAARPQDFSFAGRADFISVEEVLQLLSSGKYTGMLAIEKDDNRLDIYIRDGMVVFLDPHHLIRRVLPGASAMSYREIPPDRIAMAEEIKAKEGLPLLLALHRSDYLKAREIPDLLHNLGLEVLYEFLAEQGACTFFYKRITEMPAFVTEYAHAMPVTPILLEGSKRTDDWGVLRKVFPDRNKPVQPVSDMFARIAGMDLGVLEIKLLAMINGETSPRQLAPAIGLPLFEVYQHLVRYAQEGILEPDGGLESLHDVSFSLEESMEMAFEALDANDDGASRGNALDALADPFSKRGDAQRRGSNAAAGRDRHHAADGDAADAESTESFLDVLARTDFKQK